MSDHAAQHSHTLHAQGHHQVGTSASPKAAKRPFYERKPSNQPRPPSPTTAHLAKSKARPRSLSAPSLDRPSVYPLAHSDARGRSAIPHALPPSHPHAHHHHSHSFTAEHHGNRIQEIKEGDGEVVGWNAVTPEHLPLCARPHFRGRNFSTTSIPINPPSTPPRDSGCPMSGTCTGGGQCRSSPSHHAHSLGVHSPLASSVPMTPRTLSRSNKLQMDLDW